MDRETKRPVPEPAHRLPSDSQRWAAPPEHAVSASSHASSEDPLRRCETVGDNSATSAGCLLAAGQHRIPRGNGLLAQHPVPLIALRSRDRQASNRRFDRAGGSSFGRPGRFAARSMALPQARAAHSENSIALSSFGSAADDDGKRFTSSASSLAAAAESSSSVNNQQSPVPSQAIRPACCSGLPPRPASHILWPAVHRVSS